MQIEVNDEEIAEIVAALGRIHSGGIEDGFSLFDRLDESLTAYQRIRKNELYDTLVFSQSLYQAYGRR